LSELLSITLILSDNLSILFAFYHRSTDATEILKSSSAIPNNSSSRQSCTMVLHQTHITVSFDQHVTLHAKLTVPVNKVHAVDASKKIRVYCEGANIELMQQNESREATESSSGKSSIATHSLTQIGPGGNGDSAAFKKVHVYFESETSSVTSVSEDRLSKIVPKQHNAMSKRAKKISTEITKVDQKKKLASILSHIQEDPLGGIARLISEVNVMDESLQEAVEVLMGTLADEEDSIQTKADSRSTCSKSTLSGTLPLVHANSATSAYRQLYTSTKYHKVKNKRLTDKKLKRADDMYQKCMQQLEHVGNKICHGSGKNGTHFYKGKFTEAVKTNYGL
jgi:hypothetical protein